MSRVEAVEPRTRARAGDAAPPARGLRISTSGRGRARLLAALPPTAHRPGTDLTPL